MRLTIERSTARQDGPALCLSGRHATTSSARASATRSFSVAGYPKAPTESCSFPATFCSGYVNRTPPTITEMEETAWILRSDPRKNEIGFVKASSLKLKDSYVLNDEW